MMALKTCFCLMQKCTIVKQTQAIALASFSSYSDGWIWSFLMSNAGKCCTTWEVLIASRCVSLKEATGQLSIVKPESIKSPKNRHTRNKWCVSLIARGLSKITLLCSCAFWGFAWFSMAWILVMIVRKSSMEYLNSGSHTTGIKWHVGLTCSKWVPNWLFDSTFCQKSWKNFAYQFERSWLIWILNLVFHSPSQLKHLLWLLC